MDDVSYKTLLREKRYPQNKMTKNIKITSVKLTSSYSFCFKKS